MKLMTVTVFTGSNTDVTTNNHKNYEDDDNDGFTKHVNNVGNQHLLPNSCKQFVLDRLVVTKAKYIHKQQISCQVGLGRGQFNERRYNVESADHNSICLNQNPVDHLEQM